MGVSGASFVFTKCMFMTSCELVDSGSPTVAGMSMPTTSPDCDVAYIHCPAAPPHDTRAPSACLPPSRLPPEPTRYVMKWWLLPFVIHDRNDPMLTSVVLGTSL